MLTLDWLDQGAVEKVCPVCHDGAPKAALVRYATDGVNPRTILYCTACATRFLDPPVAAASAPAHEQVVRLYLEQTAGLDLMLEPIFRAAAIGARSVLEIGCDIGLALDFAQRAMGLTVRGVEPGPAGEIGARMFSLPILAALAFMAVVTSFISGIFGMAGGMLLIGFMLMVLPVPVAMVFHGVIQIAANSWRAWLWRHHVKWSVVLKFGAGSAASLVVFSFFDFVPDKALVLMVVGLTPFVALAVPQRVAPDIERGGQAFLAGAIGGAMQLVAGITGPLLDIFYVRTGMTRQTNIATKAAAQVLGHLTKVAYFGVLIANPAGRDLEQWLVMAYAACFAVLGTTLSRSFLDRMSDRQFYHWTRRVILAIGVVYLAQGIWLMVTRWWM